MKAIIAVIAALGAVSSFTGSAIADVSINLRFGSSPTYTSSPYYQKNRYHRYGNPGVIVREVYPSSSYNSNSWNYSNVPQSRYNTGYNTGYDTYQGDRHIIEKRIIHVR